MCRKVGLLATRFDPSSFVLTPRNLGQPLPERDVNSCRNVESIMKESNGFGYGLRELIILSTVSICNTRQPRKKWSKPNFRKCLSFFFIKVSGCLLLRALLYWPTPGVHIIVDRSQTLHMIRLAVRPTCACLRQLRERIDVNEL